MTPSRGIAPLALWLLAWPRAAAALPEDPGSLTVDTTTRTETIAGEAVTFDLYVPKGLGQPAPIVVVGHGFQRKKGNMADWGEELARRGYVTAVPDFPGVFPDHPLNAKIISGLLSWMGSASALAGKVDGARRAAVGHSAGGLAALLAAAADPAIDVVVALDPVDNDGRGIKAASAIKAPVTFVRGEPSGCNKNGAAAAIFAALASPRLSLKVKKASHCDAESPTDGLCGVICGAPDKARHLLFRRYAFATLDHLLLCNAVMAPWLGGASAKADTGVTDIVVHAGFPPKPSCSAPPDAGLPVDAGFTADAMPPPPGDSASSASDTGSTQPDAAPAGDGSPRDNNSGCSCELARFSPAALPVAILVVWPLWLRIARRGRT